MTDNNLLIDCIVEGIFEKKGEEVVNIDLRKVHHPFYDNFIICHAESATQVNAIADNIEKKVLEEQQTRRHHREGYENANWVLIDYYDVIVHVFQHAYRDQLRIEDLWGDAEIIKIEDK